MREQPLPQSRHRYERSGLGLSAARDMMGDVKLLHAWFGWFERHSVPIYRVIAVLAGASATAGLFGLLLSFLTSEPIAVLIACQGPLALGAWALLGKVEGDDRDRAFGQPQAPGSGLREPRRPLPSSPASSVELPVPAGERRTP